MWDGVREAKVHLVLNLVSTMKGNKKSFYKHISSKGRSRKMDAHC